MKKIYNFILNNIFLISGIILILFLYLPYLIFKEESFIGNPFDYLNTNVVYFKILVDNHAAFLDNCASLPNIMHQYRVSYLGEFDFIFLLFNIFSPFYALLINSFLITIIAYFSFYIFLKYIDAKIENSVASLVALCFALLPFWQFGGISIAGFPLFFMFLLKIWRKEKIIFIFYFYVILYLFYSNFIVYSLFLYFFITLFFILLYIKNKKFNLKLLIFVIASFLVLLAREYRLILFTLKPCFQTNRIGSYLSANFDISNFGTRIIRSNQHAEPHNFLIIVISIIILPLIYKNVLKNKFLVFILFYIFFSELLSLGLAKIIILKISDLLGSQSIKGLSLNRFNVINQFLWYLVFAYFINYLILKYYKYRILLLFLIIFQFLNVIRRNIPFENVRCLVDSQRFKAYVKFSDYFMLKEYKEIEKVLPSNKKSYSIIHYGFDPSASNYHNYITFDGIFPFYNREYDKDFARLIKPLLKEDPHRYDHAVLNKYIVPENYKNTYNFLQSYSRNPINLAIDFSVLKEQNVKYILSTVPLTNKELICKKIVPSQYWKNIYIYHVIF